MTTQRHPGGDLSHDGAERVQGEGREGFVASTGAPEPTGYFPRDYQQERDDLAARLAEAEAKVARVLEWLEVRDVKYPEKFDQTPSGNYVKGYTAARIDLRRALDGTR